MVTEETALNKLIDSQLVQFRVLLNLREGGSKGVRGAAAIEGVKTAASENMFIQFG